MILLDIKLALNHAKSKTCSKVLIIVTIIIITHIFIQDNLSVLIKELPPKGSCNYLIDS